MAVRIRIRVRASGSGEILTSPALINTGFETDTPQLLLPIKAAEGLKLWPPPRQSHVVTLGTAGGPAKHHLIPKTLEVRLLVSGAKTKPVVCDALISGVEEEILVNDKLGDALRIAIERMGPGEWRIRGDARVRRSVKRKLWV